MEGSDKTNRTVPQAGTKPPTLDVYVSFFFQLHSFSIEEFFRPQLFSGACSQRWKAAQCLIGSLDWLAGMHTVLNLCGSGEKKSKQNKSKEPKRQKLDLQTYFFFLSFWIDLPLLTVCRSSWWSTRNLLVV